MRRGEQVWSQSFSPLGIATVVIANDPELLATVQAAYADCRTAPAATAPTVEIRLDVHGLPSTGVGDDFAVEGSRLTITGDGVAGEADAVAWIARCSVPRRLVGDPQALAEQVTDPLLLFLLSRKNRTPFHAAGVVIADRLVLLSGPSGSGKSSLALAAAGLGLELMSDDIIFVERGEMTRFWSLDRPVHLLPQDAPDGRFAVRVRGGTRKLAVPVGETRTRFDGPARLVLLERGDSPELAAIEPQAAIERLGRLDPGFDQFRAESKAIVAELAREGAWRLTPGRDPVAAIELVRRQIASGAM